MLISNGYYHSYHQNDLSTQTSKPHYLLNQIHIREDETNQSINPALDNAKL